MSYVSWSVVAGEVPTTAKWNILGANDASFNNGTGIADSSILPEHLLTATGSSWPWQSWTPVFDNLTVGNGTLNCKYIQTGKTVYALFSFSLGSTSSVGSSPDFTFPVTANSTGWADGTWIGRWRGVAASTGFLGNFYWHTNTKCQIVTESASASYVTEASVTASVPGTWTTGNNITGIFTYEAS